LDQSQELKLKTPYYLITKFLGRIKGDKLASMMHNIEQFKRSIDEEYYDLVDHIANHLDQFKTWDHQMRIQFIRQYLGA
jgi:hypothetical protein